MMPMVPIWLRPNGRATISMCLRARFNVSFEQAANRLVTLAKPGRTRYVLHDGNRQCREPLSQGGAQGFPQAKFGGLCPRLNIHALLLSREQVLVESVQMPDRETM